MAGTAQAYLPVAQLALREPSLQTLPFLEQMSPHLLARDFLMRAASAYACWPRALLAAELDRIELALTVRRALFEGDPQGWQSYAAYVRQKVAWFGLELDEANDTPSRASDPDDLKGSESKPSSTKSGWPWKPVD